MAARRSPTPWLVGPLLALPLAGLAVLLAAPDLDVRWQHHPSHFWLVLGAAVASGGLAYGMAGAARSRGDARILLASLAFLTAAAFLGLHALATPNVLLAEPNAGFELATPAGLALAGVLAAASGAELGPERARSVLEAGPHIRRAVLLVTGAWGAWSLASLPPLDDVALTDGPLVPAVAVAGLTAYAVAGVRYLRLARRRSTALTWSLVLGFALLAEAMLAAGVARTWHATWWLWHLLMLGGFGLIASAAHASWREERFGELDLERPRNREASFLFADLVGFTTFSEEREPDRVAHVLDVYLEAILPEVVDRWGGRVDRLVGDAVMVVFDARQGDDHAERAVRAGLALQERAESVRRPEWPVFRVGVNTGVAMIGVVGAEGGRTFTAIGDAVNLAARIEGLAPPGGVAISGETLARVPTAQAHPMGRTTVKGRARAVDVHLVEGFGP